MSRREAIESAPLWKHFVIVAIASEAFIMLVHGAVIDNTGLVLSGLIYLIIAEVTIRIWFPRKESA
jgi:fucose permease